MYKSPNEYRAFLKEMLFDFRELEEYQSQIPKEIPEDLSLAYFGNLLTLVINDYKNKESKSLLKIITHIAAIPKKKYPSSVLADFTAELLEKINDKIGLDNAEVNSYMSEEMKKTILTV